MSTTIGQTVSRLRNSIKGVKADAFVTDRFLYSLVVKYGTALIKRQDTVKKMLRLGPQFRTIPCLELEETNRVEACCGGVKSDCLFKRTVLEIPDVLEGEYGPIFRSVTSVDGSVEIYPTTPSTYTSMTKTKGFKFNKNYYYWFINKRLYFPLLPWDGVMVEGIFGGDLTPYTCPEGSGQPLCTPRLDQVAPFPDFLFAEAERLALEDLKVMLQIPSDTISGDLRHPER